MPICSSCGRESEGDFPVLPVLRVPAGWLGEVAREVRKTVTVLFCDVEGSTSLGESVDPEMLREILGRYFDRSR